MSGDFLSLCYAYESFDLGPGVAVSAILTSKIPIIVCIQYEDDT